jgi:hypothetical protein
VILPLLPHEPWAPCKTSWVWAGAVMFASATCSLQFAKASAATLLQQEKNDSEDVQRGRLNIAFLPRVDPTGSILRSLYVAYPKALLLDKLANPILRFSSSSLYFQSHERRWR